MIVDDDPNIALLLEMTLRKNPDYVVEKFTEGQSALDRIPGFQPDLILLDIMMPGIDGFEVCKRIKSEDETKYISVIILSAKRDLQDKIKGMDIGADDYIVKPFNPDELLTRVQVQLRIRQLEAEVVDRKKLETVLAMAVTLQHEINNPLAGILGNADLMKNWRELNEEEVDESIDAILRQSKRIRDIVQKMSTATKVVEANYLGDTKMIDITKLEPSGRFTIEDPTKKE